MHHQQICARVIAAWIGWIFLIACFAVLAAPPEYPTRPIRLVVPFAAAGGADTLSRIITSKLGEAMCACAQTSTRYFCEIARMHARMAKRHDVHGAAKAAS